MRRDLGQFHDRCSPGIVYYWPLPSSPRPHVSLTQIYSYFQILSYSGAGILFRHRLTMNLPIVLSQLGRVLALSRSTNQQNSDIDAGIASVQGLLLVEITKMRPPNSKNKNK